MVAAPTSTIDMKVASGADIPIEERAADEVLACGGKRIGPDGVDAHNPVFDVTPAALVDCIVTERGVVEQPDAEKMRALMEWPARWAPPTPSTPRTSASASPRPSSR
jgi:methylthioribose-1-phosphate isomerase